MLRSTLVVIAMLCLAGLPLRLRRPTTPTAGAVPQGE